ncbi:hypothetical protein RHRU231_790023 [Rhodococcus ruber]|uniref:Uncharacterized protein n=1 Tax=Rhodococcus ruber TaxID=1830 RepID=A0A098BQQ4_9NOCA|nr:hypothetical protein RHRU231_790023 [Rhodococcus ruber]
MRLPRCRAGHRVRRPDRHPRRGVLRSGARSQPGGDSARRPVGHRRAGPRPRRAARHRLRRGLRLLHRGARLPAAWRDPPPGARPGAARALPRGEPAPPQPGAVPGAADRGTRPRAPDDGGRHPRRRRAGTRPGAQARLLHLLDAGPAHERQDGLVLRARPRRLGPRVRHRGNARRRDVLHGRGDHRRQLLGPRLVRVRAAGGVQPEVLARRGNTTKARPGITPGRVFVLLAQGVVLRGPLARGSGGARAVMSGGEESPGAHTEGAGSEAGFCVSLVGHVEERVVYSRGDLCGTACEIRRRPEVGDESDGASTRSR